MTRLHNSVIVNNPYAPYLGLCGLILSLVHGSAGIHSRTGVPENAPGQDRVPAPMLLLGRFLVSLCHLKRSTTTKPF